MTQDGDDDKFDSGADSDFPKSKFARGKIAARTGIKVGGNYARYLARRSVGIGEAATERSDLRSRNARDIFSQLVKLRGTALKMAQGMSLDPAFIPEEFAEVLSQAQYQVPPMGTALVRRIVKQQLGAYPEEVFEAFEPEAVAAASLGQVHRAVLPDGRDVAVKVQYPNVRESIDSDLGMARTLAERFVGAGAVDRYLNEVRERMLEETDYLNEGKNIELLAAQYSDPRIVTPSFIPEFTTGSVLTMTWVDGVHLDALLASNPSQERVDHYGQVLWDFVHDQIAADNLTVHADAHPGNFLFMDDGRIGVLDFGCVKRFPRKFRDDMIKLFRAQLEGDEASLMRQYAALELLPPELKGEQREFLVEILGDVGEIIAAPYRVDRWWFGSTETVDRFRELLPRLTGKQAFKNRRPIGSHHFVYVNRLVFGMLSILTDLRSNIDVAKARHQLLGVIED
jgi:predicted unusual protein kinase regulating ubiquinone biosynthesis (AarF/ABC1/UbiB family)